MRCDAFTCTRSERTTRKLYNNNNNNNIKKNNFKIQKSINNIKRMRWPELLLMLCASACGLILVKWALSSTGGQVNDYRDGVSVHSINLTQL